MLTNYGEDISDYYSFSNEYPFTSIEYGNSFPSQIEIRANEEVTKYYIKGNDKNAEIVMTSFGPENYNDFGSINRTVYVPLLWSSYSSGCYSAFNCTVSHTDGWNHNSSLQISQKYSDNLSHTWSWVDGNETNVISGERYQFVSHMKMNKWATQSHIVLEGFNETSKQWYQLTQCPSGINGPLDWKEFNCIITIPKSTTKIVPILNAGWSTQPNQEATTWFDAIYMKRIKFHY
jgi:hypothetical protein